MSIRQISFWADGTEEREVVLQLIKSDWCFIQALWFVFFLLSTGVGMNRSRSSCDKKAAQPPVTRLTRSSSSTQSRQSDPTETQESGPGLYGKQRKKQTDSALAQDLSQMSVSGQDSLSTRWGHTKVPFLYLTFNNVSLIWKRSITAPRNQTGDHENELEATLCYHDKWLTKREKKRLCFVINTCILVDINNHTHTVVHPWNKTKPYQWKQWLVQYI